MTQGPAGGPRPLANAKLVIVFNFTEPLDQDDAVELEGVVRSVVDPDNYLVSVNDTSRKLALSAEPGMEVEKETTDQLEQEVEDRVAKELNAVTFRTS